MEVYTNTIYRANDGTEFETMQECIDYEQDNAKENIKKTKQLQDYEYWNQFRMKGIQYILSESGFYKLDCIVIPNAEVWEKFKTLNILLELLREDEKWSAGVERFIQDEDKTGFPKHMVLIHEDTSVFDDENKCLKYLTQITSLNEELCYAKDFFKQFGYDVKLEMIQN